MLKYLLLLIVLLAAVVSARNLDSQCDFDTTSCDPCPGLLYHYEYNEFECPISCECVHDPDMLFEGDIKLEGRSLALANKLYGISSDDDASYGLTNNNGLFWPKSSDTVVVPYTIRSDLGSSAKAAINAAIADYNTHTCIRFTQRTSQSAYIQFIKGSGCWSYVGKRGGKQDVSIGNGCQYKGIVIHELMHALGFWHEQSRPDRDNYVTINWGNIRSGKSHNFNKHTAINSLGSPYDCGSIMHYRSTAFTKNGQATISTKAGVTCNMGQRAGFSTEDIKQINAAYCTKCKNVQSDHNCEYWKAQGFCSRTSQYYAYMNANCKHTCGFCRGCENKYADSSCEVWKNSGYCATSSQYFQSMRYHCRRTCGRCLVCENILLDTTCASWKTRGYCTGTYAHYTRAYCKGTCGFC